MSDLPERWTHGSVGGLFEIVGGGTPPAADASNFSKSGSAHAWLTPADLSGYKKKMITHGARDLSPKGLKSSSAKVMPAGSVLFTSRAPIGYVAIADGEISTNQGFKSFVLPEGLDASYVYYYLKSIRELAESRGTGTTFKELSGAATKELPFVVAPFEEQKRIAQKLDALLARVDTLKARIDAIPALLKRFRQSVLASAVSGDLSQEWRNDRTDASDGKKLHDLLREQHEVLGGHVRGNASKPSDEAHDLSFEDIPSQWDIASLRDICEPGRPITYGILMPGPELEEGVPYIRVADFPGNKLKLSGIKKTSSEIDFLFKRARLRAGDLLLSIRGSVGRLIKIPVLLEGANITQDTARLSISAIVSTDYIYWALLAESTQRRMRAATRGVAVRGINIGDVRALQIPLPSRDEQAEIVRRVDQLFAFADQLEAKVATAKQRIDRLTQSILAKAFRGELVPQDPNDEPASVLLERIRAQRAATPTQKRGRKPVSS